MTGVWESREQPSRGVGVRTQGTWPPQLSQLLLGYCQSSWKHVNVFVLRGRWKRVEEGLGLD